MPKKSPSIGEESRQSKPKPPEYESTKAFERKITKAAEGTAPKYLLRLYIAGANPRSARAVESVRKICEEHLTGRYELEVVDLYQNPVLAKGEQIIAVPTLLKKLPMPLRKFIGDMSDAERILVGLDLQPRRDHR